MSELKETRYAMSDKAYGLLTPDGKLWPAAGAEEDALYWLIAAAATGDITPEAVRAKLEAIGYRTTLVDITIAAPPTVNLEAGAGDLVERLRAAYQAVAEWPEKRMPGVDIATLGEGFSDLLRLRNIVPEAAAQLAAVTAENALLREALEPFAKAGAMFSWSVGPDGIDDDMTIIVEPVARREWATHLSTANFTAARAVLSQEAPK